MILNFSIANWMGFRREVDFTLVGSSERQHGKRVPKSVTLQKRVLPVAAIYGGNASGKTNLFRALHFLQNLMVHGTAIDAPIQVEPFRLDPAATQQPSAFAIEVLIDERVWDYRISCTRTAIASESLAIITRNATRTLFDRSAERIVVGDVVASDRAVLEFAAMGTRANQPFLTNAVSQQNGEFRPIYDWMRDHLVMIAPDARFGPVEQLVDRPDPYQNLAGTALERLDTGITALHREKVDLSALGLPLESLNAIASDLKQDGAVRLVVHDTQDRVIIHRSATGDLVAERLVSFHRGSDGERVRFALREESAGAQRAIDLLPVFMSRRQRPATFVIDELDRSLHTQLTRALITSYLGTCTAESRRQLLFTTHDVQLMDQQLLRRDEMWLVERDRNGVSALVPFSAFNKDNRYDKDVRKAYLLGRMGGVPHLRPLPTAVARDSTHSDRPPRPV